MIGDDIITKKRVDPPAGRGGSALGGPGEL